jgi:hypothetical protein
LAQTLCSGFIPFKVREKLALSIFLSPFELFTQYAWVSLPNTSPPTLLFPHTPNQSIFEQWDIVFFAALTIHHTCRGVCGRKVPQSFARNHELSAWLICINFTPISSILLLFQVISGKIT